MKDKLIAVLQWLPVLPDCILIEQTGTELEWGEGDMYLEIEEPLRILDLRGEQMVRHFLDLSKSPPEELTDALRKASFREHDFDSGV